ncbi:hypothetical protein R4575_17010 [Acinetobacter baumannii]|nr:hypothetical protein [Acinetobacter baumannii]
MKRLEILQASLVKKEALFNTKLENHIDDVKSANGQPLNDKRNGHVTLNRWDRQNDSLQNLNNSIQKTKNAIEREETKIAYVNQISQEVPKEILDLVSNGTLVQWRKHPNTFFVKGVDKARIVWNLEKKLVMHRYTSEIKDKGQWTLFRDVYNNLNSVLNKGKANG